MAFCNFFGDERPFSLEFEGYRSQIRSEAIIWANLFQVNFWQIPKGQNHIFRAIFPKCHFLSILEAADQRIRTRLFSTDNEVY
ncbi:unnamed protein product [Linum trigynum]|uniref:Uncharacterized protein n=1 Tax=Linum trigynum TaxID=586398 RepID=A0AAV2D6M3_9ROSI